MAIFDSLAGSVGNVGGAGAGNREYLRGQPLILRNSRYATRHNKANRAIQAMPRQKFLYYATFNPSAFVSKARNFSSWQSGFAFQISKIDRPRTTPQLRDLNQYNRKRIVHTGIKFEPVSLTLHDTVDDRVLRVWRDYYKWYFGEGRSRNSALTWDSNVIVERESMALANGWGFSPPRGSNADSVDQRRLNAHTNFFDSLDIYTFYGKKFTQIRIYNPKIANIQFDALESASSDLSTVEMSIDHEGYEYTNVAAPISAKEVELFDLNGGDYYEPADAFGGVNAFLMDLNDNLESSLDSLLGNVRNIPFVGGVLAGLGGNVVRASGVTGFIPRLTRGLSSSSLGRWGNF